MMKHEIINTQTRAVVASSDSARTYGGDVGSFGRLLVGWTLSGFLSFCHDRLQVVCGSMNSETNAMFHISRLIRG